MKFSESVIMVTGGSSGLGRAVVELAVADGAKVAILDMNEDAGAALARDLGVQAIFCRTDVADEADARAALDATIKAFGRVDMLVNCAGIAYGERILHDGTTHDLAAFNRTISINLIGTFNMMRLAAEAMTRNEPGDRGERGVIINVASIAAYEGQTGQAAYAASKGGVASMTLPAARELAHFGIRVAGIAPGVFRTPMVGKFPAKMQAGLDADAVFPTGAADPEEFGLLVRHIAENLMLNGSVLRLDAAARLASR